MAYYVRRWRTTRFIVPTVLLARRVDASDRSARELARMPLATDHLTLAFLSKDATPPG